MEESIKEGYLAGGLFLIVGILALSTGFDQGINNGKMTIIIGAILSLLGGGSIWKPETIGQVLSHYLNKQTDSHGDNQSQKNNINSNQIIAGTGAKVNVTYSIPGIPEEKESNEKRELIKEINQDLSKEKLSNVLIKCIRLATLSGSEKDKIWLEKEAIGLGKGGIEVKKGTLPAYREINAKIIIADKNGGNMDEINYPLGLIHPIFQIEGWIDEYYNKSGAGRMILTAPPSDTLKKIHMEIFGENIPDREIPSIIPISELKKILNGLKIRVSEFVNSVK